MTFCVNQWTWIKHSEPERFEREMRAVLRKTHGNLSHAADELGVSRRTVRRWVEGGSVLQEYARKLRDDAAKPPVARKQAQRKAARAA